MTDLIDRQTAINTFSNNGSIFVFGADICKAIVSRIELIPSAQPDLSESDRMRYASYGLLPPVEPDLSEYSDKLWKAAYERGRAEARAEKHTEERTKTHARDLIDRQASIEHLKKRLYETEFNSTAEYPYYQEIADNRVDVWMSEVPSAQPKRKPGHWVCKMTKDHIGCNVKLYMCSECNGWSGDFTDRFCRHCGAYMGGEQE